MNKALNVTVKNKKLLAHLKYEQREPLNQSIRLAVMFDDTFCVGNL
ncbi:hypothetical protein [Pseudomonas syringae]|nr:hypothetical protein [Pseudomonas syringae]